jgi:methionyl-tRNA formyltransferase
LLDEKITASTLFWIDEGMDSGPLLAQRFFHIAPDETAASLYAKHMSALGGLLDETLPRLAVADCPGERQDDRLATWGGRRRPSDGRIDWHRPASEVERLIRAVGRPYPGAFAGDDDRRVTIWAARSWPPGQSHHALPGQVIARQNSGFAVCCGDGRAIEVTEFDAAAGKQPALHSVLGS